MKDKEKLLNEYLKDLKYIFENLDKYSSYLSQDDLNSLFESCQFLEKMFYNNLYYLQKEKNKNE